MPYDPSGNFWQDGRNLGQAQYTPNNGGFWYVLNAAQNGYVTVPAPPQNPNTDPRGPGGANTTADPLNPGYWYRDNPAVIGGIERIDAAGNVVGQYANTTPLTQGGSAFDITQRDPATGGPAVVQYPTVQGGFMGLGDIGGSLAAVAMLAAIGASAGTLAGPVAAGTAGTTTAVGAGATLGSAGLTVASQADQNAELAKAAMALGLVGAGTGAVGSIAGASNTAQAASAYASAAKTGLGALARTTGNQELGQAAQAAGYAGTAAGAADTFSGGDGSDTLPGSNTGDTLQGSNTVADEGDWSLNYPYDPNAVDTTATPDWQTNLVNTGLQGGGGQVTPEGDITTAPETVAGLEESIRNLGGDASTLDTVRALMSKLGLRPQDALKLALGLGGAGLGAIMGANPQTGPNTGPGTDTQGTANILTQGRNVALAGVPLQLSNLYDAVGKLRSRAAGGTAELFPAVQSQLASLRGQYAGASEAIARRLGYGGGGQVERGKQAALTQATSQYANLLGKGQQAGFAQLINTLGGVQPTLSGQAKPPSVGVRTGPYDSTLQGVGLADLVKTAGQVQKWYNGQNASPGMYSNFTTPGLEERPDLMTLGSDQEF